MEPRSRRAARPIVGQEQIWLGAPTLTTSRQPICRETAKLVDILEPSDQPLLVSPHRHAGESGVNFRLRER